MTPATDLVIGHHLDPFRSGVARFNALLAGRLGVGVVSLHDAAARAARRPLLSFKTSELDAAERADVAALVERLSAAGFDVFLHEFDADDELDRSIAGLAARCHCGNDAVLHAVTALGVAGEPAWAPGLIVDCRRMDQAPVSVFSFGMAHKVRTDSFARLRELLEATGREYALRMSHANHETSTLAEAELVFEEMRRVIPRGLFFLGNLSDVAIYNELLDTTFFAAFFAGGVRANNTSVASAMEHGAVVITNLDEFSPPELVHLENVIDIERCDALPLDPPTLERIGSNARRTAAERGWDQLVGRLRSEAPVRR